MIADVLLHHFRGDLITDRAGKIPILPEFWLSFRLFQLGKLLQETQQFPEVGEIPFS